MKNAAELKSAGHAYLDAAQRGRPVHGDGVPRTVGRQLEPHAHALAASARYGLGSGPGERTVVVPPARKPREQQRGLHLRARHRQLVVDAVQVARRRR